MRFRTSRLQSWAGWHTLGLCGALLMPAMLASSSYGQATATEKPAQAASPAPIASSTTIARAIVKTLQMKIDFSLAETPLSKVVEYIKESTKLEIQIDMRAMEDAGIMTDFPITFSAKGISVQSALALILRPVGLTWTIRDDILLITTTDEAEQSLTTQVYVVLDLVTPKPSYRFERTYLPGVSSGPFSQALPAGRPVSSSAELGGGTGNNTMGGMGGGMGGGGGMFSLPDQPAVVNATPTLNSPMAAPLAQQATQPAVQPTAPATTQPAAQPTEQPTSPQVTPPASQSTPSSDRSPSHGARNAEAGAHDGSHAQQMRGTNLSLTMDDLIRVITTIIKPTSWDTVGGPGAIVPAGDVLIVSQTWEVHLEIERLLADLREASPGQKAVSLRATWLLLNLDQLNELLLSKADKVSPEGVDRKALEAMAAKVPGRLGAITCFNGQTVHIASGRLRSEVASAIPVVGGETECGYQPFVRQPQSGALLQVTPQLMPNAQSVVLDLCSVVTRAEGPAETIAFLGGEAATKDKQSERKSSVNAHTTVTLDRLKMSVGQLATTLKVPLGEPTLIGGLTREPTLPDTGEETAAATPQLYLFIEATSK